MQFAYITLFLSPRFAYALHNQKRDQLSLPSMRVIFGTIHLISYYSGPTTNICLSLNMHSLRNKKSNSGKLSSSVLYSWIKANTDEVEIWLLEMLGQGLKRAVI